jgi:hypothetical protein
MGEKSFLCITTREVRRHLPHLLAQKLLRRTERLHGERDLDSAAQHAWKAESESETQTETEREKLKWEMLIKKPNPTYIMSAGTSTHPFPFRSAQRGQRAHRRATVLDMLPGRSRVLAASSTQSPSFSPLLHSSSPFSTQNHNYSPLEGAHSIPAISRAQPTQASSIGEAITRAPLFKPYSQQLPPSCSASNMQS